MQYPLNVAVFVLLNTSIDGIFLAASVQKQLLTITSVNQSGDIGLDRMYVSVHDAVLSCRQQHSISGNSVSSMIYVQTKKKKKHLQGVC